MAPRWHHVTTFVRTGQWPGAPLPQVNRAHAQAELVRRYLHCCGPSTAEHLAAWAGVAPAQAAQAWSLVERELVEVNVDRRTTWLQQRDLPRFTSFAESK
ncbi:MAG TPA: crosslink repair DNA glycosylase YcaQ family protein [Anaerolineae bacterium]|nr:crosslink repair DNA glycosylase YcaQ family protein [Anaerolineae bacterium]